MIENTNLRRTVVKGLKKYLGCPVIMNNQNAPPPAYPYVSYTVTTPTSENRGTYGKYSDGYARKPVTQTWSITAQSDDEEESITLANKAREWLDYAGTLEMNDNGVIVQSVGVVGNRDNVLTVEYEYKNGFDVEFWMVDEVEEPESELQGIEVMEFGDNSNTRLENRLDGVEQNEYGISQNQGEGDAELLALLENRLSGVD